MTRVFTKQTKKSSTTWTFTTNGAYKTTKLGNSYYGEMPLGSKLANEFIDELINKNFEESLKKA